MGACCASKMAWVQIPIIHIKLCVCSLVIERTETGRSLGSLASQRHWTIEVQGQWETLRLKKGGEWAIEEIPNVLVWSPCMCAYAWLLAMVLSCSSRRSCALWPLWAPGMQCTQMHSGKALLHIKKKNEMNIKRANWKPKSAWHLLPSCAPVVSSGSGSERLHPSGQAEESSQRTSRPSRFLTRLLRPRKCPLRQDEAPSYFCNSATLTLEVFIVTELLVFEWMSYHLLTIKRET